MIDPLSPVVVANLIGGAGYLLFALSPLARSRGRYLAVHGVAMIPIAAHYVMLSAVPGAVLSLVYLGADIVGARWPGRRWPLAGLTGLALVAFATTFQAPIDFLGLFGTVVFVLSRAVEGHARTLAIAALSTVTWGAYGWFEDSLSQVIFSALYAVFCIYSLYRLKPLATTS